MKVLKKVTFYWNQDHYEGFSKNVNVFTEMSDTEIVKNVVVISLDEDLKDLDFGVDSFYNKKTDIITDFKVEELDIIDLT